MFILLIMKKIVSIILVLIIGLCPVLSYADELVSEVVKSENDSFILKLSLISGPTIKVNGEKLELDVRGFEIATLRFCK